MTQAVKETVTTSELLRKSGISSFDLHNWIKRGLLPRSCSSIAYGGDGIRYWYPAWAVECASDIRRLRGQGYSMPKVRKILRGEKVEL